MRAACCFVPVSSRDLCATLWRSCFALQDITPPTGPGSSGNACGFGLPVAITPLMIGRGGFEGALAGLALSVPFALALWIFLRLPDSVGAILMFCGALAGFMYRRHQT
jgi:hypothetical protein